MTDLSGVTIEASGLEVYYSALRALNISHLTITGRIIGLIGHNGSGKSTLIKTVLELIPARRGLLNVRSARHPVRLTPEVHMAFSPEKGAVFEDLTVNSYLNLWCRLKQVDVDFRRGAAQFFDRLNISPLLNKLGRELSKGERQRVQAFLGFLVRPKLFLFDEPFDGLDIRQSSELSDLMREQSSSTAILVSSHRMETIERVADQLIVLREGQVAASGTVEDVCNSICSNAYAVIPEGGSLPKETIGAALRRAFPDCVVNDVGRQVSIFGTSVERSVLEEESRRILGDRMHLERISPTLLDAMNYFLR